MATDDAADVDGLGKPGLDAQQDAAQHDHDHADHEADNVAD